MFARSVSSIAVRSLGSAAAFGFSVLVARRYGIAASGAIFSAVALVSLLGVVARAGLDTMVLRRVAQLHAQGNEAAMSGLLRVASWACLAIALVLAVLLALFQDALAVILESRQVAATASILAWAIVPLALVFLWAEALKARGDSVVGQAYQTLWIPAIALGWLALRDGADVQEAAWAYAGASGIVFAVAATHIHRTFARIGASDAPPVRHLLRESLPLMLMNLSVMAGGYVDMLVLDVFADSATVGAYGAAAKLALLVHIIPVAMGGVVGPRFAQLDNAGESAAFTRYARKAARTGLALSIPPVVVLLVAPQFCLGIFGQDFVSASSALRVLAGGFLVHQFLGFGGIALAMCGQGRFLLVISFLGLVAAVVLGAALGRSYGAEGVAWSVVSSLVLVKLLAAIRLHRKHGVIVWA